MRWLGRGSFLSEGFLGLERCGRFLVRPRPVAPIAYVAPARRILGRSAPLTLWPLRRSRHTHRPLTFDGQRAWLCTHARALRVTGSLAAFSRPRYRIPPPS